MILSMNVASETSDSNNNNKNNDHRIRATKRARVLQVAAKFKGVVPQNNGHFGAQIYANHQRIWLGTFKSEIEAAMAYDSAAIKLRNGDSHRNFPWSDSNTQESIFQNNYSPQDVLNMIRDGSYRPKLEDFLMTQSQVDKIGSNNLNRARVFHGTDTQFSCVQLFQKELTPSDVGKLNRLVIPKRFAVKYFPYMSEDAEDHDDLELGFYDKDMRPWKFRYCYWKSSQSFVFTRGWNKFVKEKGLNEKDIVTFYLCECHGERSQKFRLIDVVCGDNNGYQRCVLDAGGMLDEMHVGLELKLGQRRADDEKDLEAEKALMGLGSASSTHNAREKGFRLFGVPINV